MLNTLVIKNFAIIDDITISFDKNMNVITGETGSGKSIIITAIDLLLGARSSTNLVKRDCEKSYLRASFSLNEYLKVILDNLDIEYDDVLELERVIKVNGNSTYKINGCLTQLNVVKQITDGLVDIHSQSASNHYFDDDNLISYLDLINSIDYDSYSALYEQFIDISTKINDLSAIRDEFEYQMALDELSHINEISAYDGELEELIAKSNKLNNLEKLVSTKQILDDSKDHLIEQLTTLDKTIEKLQLFDIKVDYELFKSLNIEIIELLDSITIDEEEEFVDINQIESRIYTINKLIKRYGNSYSDVVTKAESLNNFIYEYENSEYLLKQAHEQLNLILPKLEIQAQTISTLRKQNALIIENEVNALLKLMYMEDAAIKFEFKHTNYLKNGFDDISILISTNLNDFQTINKVASGGEKSRVIFAIKCVFAKFQNYSTVILDEIDTGVSGRVAKSMGLLMRELASNTQLIVITHLPQVSSIASKHLLVEKSNSDGEYISNIKTLDYDEKIEVIAKMLSGEEVTTEAISNATAIYNEMQGSFHG